MGYAGEHADHAICLAPAHWLVSHCRWASGPWHLVGCWPCRSLAGYKLLGLTRYHALRCDQLVMGGSNSLADWFGRRLSGQRAGRSRADRLHGVGTDVLRRTNGLFVEAPFQRVVKRRGRVGFPDGATHRRFILQEQGIEGGRELPPCPPLLGRAVAREIRTSRFACAARRAPARRRAASRSRRVPARLSPSRCGRRRRSGRVDCCSRGEPRFHSG